MPSSSLDHATARPETEVFPTFVVARSWTDPPTLTDGEFGETSTDVTGAGPLAP
jgi:hypothetical protein